MPDVLKIRVPESAVLDVVFLHGLDGDARKSWTGRSFWPEWLAEDFARVAVWSVGYEAWSTGWRGTAMPMQDRAINLMARLQNLGIGQRPLCFVTHSMGGLLAKEILLHAAEGRTEFAVFAKAARGVVFLGTPHTGSGLAGVVKALGLVYRATAAVKDLKRNAAHLRHLNDRYRDWADESGIRSLVFFEAYPTKGVRVVDEVSANPGLPRVRPIPVDADHVDICKPADRDSLVYGQIAKFITDILAEGDTSAPVRKLPADTGVFVGRTDELARLESVATTVRRVAVVAVHGLGGVGKSTLAARFAELHADSFSLVWWVTADTVAAIDDGLAELAVALSPDSVGLPWEQRTELAMGWLAGNTGWLLILDNLTAPAQAARLLERVRTGTILITSRQGIGWRGVSTLPLDVLAPDEAVELFGRVVRAEWPEADLADAEELCAELGYLPLAVEQAAAYLVQARITPARYLDLLTRFPARMFTATAEGGDAQRTMARVWHVTLDRLTDTPLAAKLLHRLAWHAPDRIPRSLLEDAGEEPDLSEALGRLAAYSMITLDLETIDVHRLVQAVTRTPDPADPHRLPEDIARARDDTAASLARALDDTDPRLPGDWPAFQAVLPHAQALLEHADADALCVLANHLGLYVLGQGKPAVAIALSSRAVQGSERLYGTDHPVTLRSLNSLAAAYQAAGEVRRAISLFKSTLADQERVLGAEHPETLTCRNNLAAAHQAVGEVRQAIAIHEETLAGRVRVLGTDHPDTLSSRNNLAMAYAVMGDAERALPLHEATLADREQVLGPDAPETLLYRNNLAYAHWSVGDVRKAISLFTETLTGRERVLGEDHPDTLFSRNNLAAAYESAGDLPRAIEMYERTLFDRERILGNDHPDTLNSRNNLAGAYESAGDLPRAIEMYERTLADRERVLGQDHADTLNSRNNLAYVHGVAGDLPHAIRMYEAALADAERVLGPEHRVTRTLRENVEAAIRVRDRP
ncbi:FxSxx-COOH system tetratricopeptide repeat protein [Amycolatopsis pittospori]|uniref:FxSxx-COOH system tetratricopeptide repeat protein n=1 Tax=Amycolatopsis pittospori TaxID=2749434 RepID=UPI0015F0A041|nr:FxSxx-COOH system tetratricopeptide repeat protein [Amycolatopsis pittospori]